MINIAGGGIAGLVLGLTLHQLGLPFRIYERVAEPKPLPSMSKKRIWRKLKSRL